MSSKIDLLLEEIIDTDDFQDFVKYARDKYKIPKGGFKKRARTPSSLKVWKYSKNPSMRQSLEKEVRELCKKHCLHRLYGSEVITAYLLYGIAKIPYTKNLGDMCFVSDVVEERKHPFAKITRKEDEYFYPISVRISPQASQRDIIKYIKAVYDPEIKQLQEKYKDPKSSLGKYREKDPHIRERAQFIYYLSQKEHLSPIEIVSRVQQEYGELLDHGHISKIISLERGRASRKEV